MIGYAERTWLILIGLTFVGVIFAERGHAGWLLTLTVVALIAVKSSIVIDHYMEMRAANQRFRNLLRLFAILVPILVILSHSGGEVIRRLTTLN